MINGRRAVALCVALAAPELAHAQSEVRFTANTSANAGFSNNPFSDPGKDNASAFVEVEARPRAELVMERNVISLEARGRLRQYTRKYSTTDSYGASLKYRGSQSARLNTHMMATYDSAIIGQGDLLSGMPEDGEPGTLPDPTELEDPDIALLGSRARRNTLKISGDAQYTLSARDSINASAFAVQSRYDRFLGIGDYNGYGGSLGYSRQLTQYLQFGGQASYNHYLYPNTGRKTGVTSLNATMSARLNALWTVNGSLGISIVDSDLTALGLGPSPTTTSLSGSLSACRTAARSSFCLNGSRSVRPTGAGDTSTVTSIGATYRYRLTERDSVSVAADYSNNEGQSTVLPLATDYLRSKVSYERTLSQRLRAIGSLHYRGLYGKTVSREADFGAQIGISYKFGDPR